MFDVGSHWPGLKQLKEMADASLESRRSARFQACVRHFLQLLQSRPMTSNVEHSPSAGAVVGLVLAGGRSVRFEGEKAAADLAGRPLILWAAKRLQRSCPAVAANVRPGTETGARA